LVEFLATKRKAQKALDFSTFLFFLFFKNIAFWLKIASQKTKDSAASA